MAYISLFPVGAEQVDCPECNGAGCMESLDTDEVFPDVCYCCGMTGKVTKQAAAQRRLDMIHRSLILIKDRERAKQAEMDMADMDEDREDHHDLLLEEVPF